MFQLSSSPKEIQAEGGLPQETVGFSLEKFGEEAF
jgi:hypothetical protein